uniref:Prohibitin n=2 Tax=Hemiselmis andersenii TaxID=464988 RepID=A0A6U4JE51_HEMAN|mmetsp:Transcript_8885/g.20751  ORF Transcript_8885/g.20751 Transcript_8885/m.20751 type:complete len:297 (-) Transcript_8885:1100-1990(-)
MNRINVQVNRGAVNAMLGGLGLLTGGYVLVNHCMFNVEGGHRAIMYSRFGGITDRVLGEGTHFRIPWVQRPYIYNVRSTPRNIKSLTGSRDLQMVDINLRVIYRPQTESLPQMYRTLGLDYDERVLPSIVNEVLKSVVAQYNAIELIVKREQVSTEVRNRLQERAKDFFILLDDVSITHLAFSPQFTSAVESKQVAQQDAERAKWIVEKATEEKKSIIIAAQGEAEAAKMIANAINQNPGFIELREIQYAKDVAETLSTSSNKVYLNSDALLVSGIARALGRDEHQSKSKGGWLWN